MPLLTAVVYNRDFTARPQPPLTSFDVESYAWHVIGGPLNARLRASGTELALTDLLGLLRSPIEIMGPRAEAVWWGYIDAVEVTVGAMRIGVSLDNMVNKVYVVYTRLDPGSSGPGVRATTGATTSTLSTGVYGTKERYVTADRITDIQATQFANTYLEQHKLPIPRVDWGPPGVNGATITCRGWWNTLDWRHYTNSNTGNIQTTAQITAVVTAAGEFLRGTRILNASSYYYNEYQDGDKTARVVLEDLLRQGTSANKRLLATVTRDRWLEVYQEWGQSAYDLFIGADGRLRTPQMGMVQAYTCPVGFWARFNAPTPSALDLSYIAPASPVFIDETAYDVGSDRLSFRARDVPSPFEMLRVAD
jgi:hypothetical protein